MVVSSAIEPDNPENLGTKKLHLPIEERQKMLAEIMRLRSSIRWRNARKDKKGRLEIGNSFRIWAGLQILPL